MAIRTFNSVGGFSVGEIPTNVIDPNGIGSFTSIKTDHLYYANGNPWDLQEAAGSNGYIQFNTSNNFDASANLSFALGANYANGQLDTFTVGGNIVSTNITANKAISANTIGANTITVDKVNAGNIDLAGDFKANGNMTIGGDVNITGNMSVGTITGNLVGNVTGNFSGNITGGATISAPGSDTYIIFNDGNTLQAASGFHYIKAVENVSVSRVEVSDNFTVGGYANITGVTSLGNTLSVTGAANLASTLSVTGAANLADTLGVAGISTLANVVITTDASVGNTLTLNNLSITGTVTGDLTPTTNYGGNLGSETNAWKDLWLSGSTINLGTQKISSNATGTTLSNVTSMATIAVTGSNTTTDKLTGAVVVAGGVGIGGNIYVAGKANIEGDVLIGKVGTEANANITGKLQVGGDAAINGNAAITGNITITGDLTVGGNTTYVNTTNTSIKDAIIDLGGAGSGADNTGVVVGDRGLLLHGSNTVNQFVGWNTGNSEFQMLATSTVANGAVTGTAANLRLNTLYSDHTYGVIETATQPNITTMLGLTSTMTTNANITTGRVSTLYASGLKYPTADGVTPASNEVTVLKTDGANTLGFTTIHTDRIANASSSVMVNMNGSTDVTFNGNLVFTVIGTGANVTGVLKSSTSVDTPTINATTVVITPKVSIGTTAIYSATANSASTSATVIATVDATSCRAVDFLVKGEAAGKYTVATITAIHNGTDVDYAVHSKLHFGDTGAAGSFTVELNGGNIQLKATPTVSTNTVWTTQIRTV